MRPVRRATLPVMVAEEIRRDIIHGALKPGDKLPTETELGRQLGVGRPTVREALRILEGQGWVRFKFGQGAYIMENSKISQKTLAYFKKEEVLELLEQEIRQLEQEGKDVTEKLREAFRRIKKEGSPEDIEDFYHRLESLEERDDYPYEEPSDLEEIERRRSGKDLAFPKIPEDSLQDRLHGAWLGRCVGCLLGKPVEGWPRQEIDKYLKATNSYPLSDYFPYEPEKLENEEEFSFHPSAREATRENISYMARDDDIDYTILNLKLIEENGLEFTTEDVAEEWLANLPYKKVYTAEYQAYSNLVHGLTPPGTATYRNPFREWIGAQIRADIFGYVAPGDPQLAASLAYRDARLSHTKNGIYGEMFVAAAIAAALTGCELDTVIDAGLSQVPEKSRLAEVVQDVKEWRRTLGSWEDAWEKANKKYGYYHFVHTLPNLAFVLIGLLFGELDFRRTVSIAVMCGYDTDCNGATAGSILGALKGKDGIPEDMAEPLHDKVRSAVFGFAEMRISELARRTFEVGRKNLKR